MGNRRAHRPGSARADLHLVAGACALLPDAFGFTANLRACHPIAPPSGIARTLQDQIPPLPFRKLSAHSTTSCSRPTTRGKAGSREEALGGPRKHSDSLVSRLALPLAIAGPRRCGAQKAELARARRPRAEAALAYESLAGLVYRDDGTCRGPARAYSHRMASRSFGSRHIWRAHAGRRAGPLVSMPGENISMDCPPCRARWLVAEVYLVKRA